MCLSVFRAFKWSGNTHYKDYATSYICFEPDFLGASLVIMFSQVAHDAQKGNKETIYVKMLASVLTPMKLPDVCAVGSSGYPVELVKPLGHGFSRVEFASPDLFLRCNVEGKQHDTSCLLLLDKQNAESNDNHPCAKYHVEIDNTQKLYLILLLYQLLHQLFSSLLPRLDEIGSNVENANVATAQGRSQLAKLQRPKDQIHLRYFITFDHSSY
ncbi:hypothetical protein RND71_016027 [Anisodus tanguticus]|uniref:Uncharacterized protein n=1 Tax=Anisodus tanguticus TaxID=243964 RepID=A0AAE1S7X3_9SOLA|nr:hypothetical protein RND71_016027 [Anisodus tanguticus]